MERLPSDTNPSTDLESGPGTSFANNRESSLSSGHGDDNDDLRIEQISSKDSGVDPASVLFQSYYPEALNRPHSDISWVGSVQNFLLFVIGTLSGRATDAGYFKAYPNRKYPIIRLNRDQRYIVVVCICHSKWIFRIGASIVVLATLSSMSPDLKKPGIRFGIILSIASLASMTGPPTSGALIHLKNGEYLYAQIFSGASMAVDPNDIEPLSGEEESEEEEDEESEADSGPSKEMTREERKAAAKARKEAAIAKKKMVLPGELPPSEDEDEDVDMPANPNHTAKSRSQAAMSPAETNGEAVPAKSGNGPLSRKEREAIQSQQARERYMKLHAEGKTEEARADLARLAIIKERREAEKARKEAEKEEREEREREKAEAKAREAKLREAALGPGAKGKKLSPKKK
ncbi:hypothetical protein ACO22_06819 [Paracoccidioides brasiliensis]|uniref:Casein kinase substrate phosphoprotein PP28 domain-containing protein n=1 Tax=Paracoccidioides brasiliensis TaxID=121759 RepID=A0A1D2J6D3_PARBR|nr:hypothetical protein ACO22_06819 [Paracoccidioides brasiliensis]